MIVIKFFFDYGEIYTCLWVVDQNARDKFGESLVDLDQLPLSNNLKGTLQTLCEEFQSSLDWNNPPGPSPWTIEHWLDFIKRAREAYMQLKNELGADYIIESGIEDYWPGYVLKN